ncbi:hypothetical protein ACN2XU_02335 [Primorskyibacter sp. 2E107]|uniref:hypothetical protein n=1 Tax=Primorskyibacter sp. 2E107 TaxID=3403458 RepID=UPI003AF46122
MKALAEAAPVFIGVLLGLALLFSSLAAAPVFGFCVFLCIAGLAISRAARTRLSDDPARAVVLWQGAVLLPVGLIALTTAVITWFGINLQALVALLPDWLLSQEEVSASYKPFATVLTGAVNTLVAALWLDDSKDAKSGLWPAGQIKPAFEAAFRKDVQALKEQNKDYLPLEEALTGDPEKWNFRRALQRAETVKANRPAPS